MKAKYQKRGLLYFPKYAPIRVTAKNTKKKKKIIQKVRNS